MEIGHLSFNGLSEQQVIESRRVHGINLISKKQDRALFRIVKELLSEPMILILFVAAVIYIISGHTTDAFFLIGAIVLIAAISLYQNKRSRSALEKLQALSEVTCKVIREGTLKEVLNNELVIGDILMVEEGGVVAGDGRLVFSNDFTVDESILTGEAIPVFKNTDLSNNLVYKGTMISSGMALVEIMAIGDQSELGKIGQNLSEIKEEKSPLEIQINSFVTKMVIVGAIIFFLVWIINYIRFGDFINSLLQALTLAMSILPEEIPVAFATFMALGAFRLMKMGIIVKKLKTIETLGSTTVICLDKTGTITENRMEIEMIYSLADDALVQLDQIQWEEHGTLIGTAMWASEPMPFDRMEQSIHSLYERIALKDLRPSFDMVHEYPLGGTPPMMTHIYENSKGESIVAAKGAPEAILNVCPGLSQNKISDILSQANRMAQSGLRILGVAKCDLDYQKFPKTQQEIEFQFMGLIGFYDPPKKNISNVFQKLYDAGIKLKIITGDYPTTTSIIANKVEFKNADKIISGEELMGYSETELREVVQKFSIFSRMFPAAKLRIIEALKANGEIVAMTGDGVNDALALKAAHIGTAMGARGTEIAKRASSLILVDDDLGKLVDGVAMGRKIYNNLKKAIRYIISIHIPIILIVFVPLVLNWVYPNIFTPVHVIFLELIMGPTCSIVFENEPLEKGAMHTRPRMSTRDFFSLRELTISIIQGVAITLGLLFIYQWAVRNGYNQEVTRSMVFVALISANVILTLVNRSFTQSIIQTLANKNNLMKWMLGITIGLMVLIFSIPALSSFFKFEQLTLSLYLRSMIVGVVSVSWFEFIKMFSKLRPQ